jgi:hypothetical protein
MEKFTKQKMFQMHEQNNGHKIIIKINQEVKIKKNMLKR